jgi:hypothetical protein
MFEKEIFEETLRIAEEEDAVISTEINFVTFMMEYLPHEYIDVIEKDIGATLNDIWKDRYQKVEEMSNEESFSYDDGSCEICERYVVRTRHHLIPRELHKSLSKDSRYTKELLGRTISICRMCHSTIHRFFTNDDLARRFNTVEILLEDERMFKYAKWASAQPSRGDSRVR